MTNSPPFAAGSSYGQLADRSVVHTYGEPTPAVQQADWYTYHCLKGVASIWTMQFLTSVLVRTSSLLLALYTTSSSLVFLVMAVRGVKVMIITGHSSLSPPSDPHEKFPESSLSARYLMLPPLVRTLWILLGAS